MVHNKKADQQGLGEEKKLLECRRDHRLTPLLYPQAEGASKPTSNARDTTSHAHLILQHF
jgi:hypothetical protein